MTNKKAKRVKGSVLYTVIAVMMIMTVLVAAALALASSANKRAYNTYADNQAQYTARSVVDSMLKVLEKNGDAAVGNVDIAALNASLDPALGKVTEAKIENVGKFSDYGFNVQIKNAEDANLYKLTATIKMAGQENTVALYCTNGDQPPNPHSSKLTLMTLGPMSVTAGENVNGGLSSFVDDSKSGNVYMDQHTELSGPYRTGGNVVMNPYSDLKIKIDSYNDYENGASNKGVYIGRNLVMRSADTLDLDFFENISSSIKYKNLPHFYIGGSWKTFGSPEITIGSYEQPFITMMGSMVLGEVFYNKDTNFKRTTSIGNSKIYGDVYLYEQSPESVITASENSGIYPFKPGIISDTPGYTGGNLYSLGTVNVISPSDGTTPNGTLANNVVADKIVFWNTNDTDKETTTGSVVAKSADFTKSTATNPNWKFNGGLFTDPDNFNIAPDRSINGETYYGEGKDCQEQVEVLNETADLSSANDLSVKLTGNDPLVPVETVEIGYDFSEKLPIDDYTDIMGENYTSVVNEIKFKVSADPGVTYENKYDHQVYVPGSWPPEYQTVTETTDNDFTVTVKLYDPDDPANTTKDIGVFKGKFGDVITIDKAWDSYGNSSQIELPAIKGVLQLSFNPNGYEEQNGWWSVWKCLWGNAGKPITVNYVNAKINANAKWNGNKITKATDKMEFLKAVNNYAFELSGTNTIEIKDIDKTVTITRNMAADGVTPESLTIENSKDSTIQTFDYATQYADFMRAVVDTVTFPESMYYNDTELNAKFSSDVLTFDNDAKARNKAISDDLTHSDNDAGIGTGTGDWTIYEPLQYPSIASYKVLTGYESAKGFVDTTSNQKYMAQINQDSAEWTYDNHELAEKFDWENKNVPIYSGSAGGIGIYCKFLYSEYEAGLYPDINAVTATKGNTAADSLKITDDCILTGVFENAKIEIDPAGKDIYVGLYKCELRSTDIVVEDGSGKGNVYFFVPKDGVSYVRWNFSDPVELAGGWKYNNTGMLNEKDPTKKAYDKDGYIPYYSDNGHLGLYNSNILTRYYYDQLGSGELNIYSSEHKPNIFLYLDSHQDDMEIYYDSSIISATVMGKTTTLLTHSTSPRAYDVIYDDDVDNKRNMTMGIIGNAVFNYVHFNTEMPFFYAEGSNGNSSPPPDPSNPQSMKLTKLYYQAS